MYFILLIILLSFIEFVGDTNLKIYARTDYLKNLLIGIVAYILLVKLYIEALKQSNLIFTNAMWDAISTIITTILAFFILHESLTNWQQWVGLITIIIGILLLNYGKKPI
jgi:multidrug transporter EmrE-like cation transporter